MGEVIRRIRAWWLLQDYVKRGDEGSWLLTPPPCLRHITPWKLLNWINDHSGVCWANVVMWKMFGREGSWWPTSMCFHPYDYCGKFDGERLPECEREILISIATAHD